MGCQALSSRVCSQNAVNRNTGFSLFQVIYGLVPRGPLDMLALPCKVRPHATAVEFMDQLHQIHQQTHSRLTASTAKYKLQADQKCQIVEFSVGDYVWAILTRDRFPAHENNKLAARKIGPLEITDKINQNAYHLQLSSHVHTSDVFNVKHLIPYSTDASSEDEMASDSRANLFHPGEDDAVKKYIPPKDNT